jgi:hypothetical protein
MLHGADSFAIFGAMIHLKNICVLAIMLVLGISLQTNLVIAQGPPVYLDSCVVATTQKFKELPVPGKFVPGGNDALKICPNLTNCAVKFTRAKIGKAKNLRIELRLQAGKLVQSTATTVGEKNFRKLYEEIAHQAGRPSKMVLSQGKRAYSWDMDSKLDCDVALLYDPATGVSEAIFGVLTK